MGFFRARFSSVHRVVFVCVGWFFCCVAGDRGGVALANW